MTILENTEGSGPRRFAPLARLWADREPVPNPVAAIRAVAVEATMEPPGTERG
ncbi:MAG: hypothetical protein WCH77_10900 [Planctomycetota bacterium]